MDSIVKFIIVGYMAACIVPSVVSYALWNDPHQLPFSRFAAVYTIKPLIVLPVNIPIAFLFAQVFPSTQSIGWPIALSAVSVTLIILWFFRLQINPSNRPAVTTLIVLDTLRWMSTVGVVSFAGLLSWLSVISLILPSVFAAIAWYETKTLHQRVRHGD
jgi:hypothetical protein